MSNQSLFYYALDKNKDKALNDINNFLTQRNQNLRSFAKSFSIKISVDTENYNAFPTDESLIVPDDQISVARGLNQKGRLAIFNKLDYVNNDGIAMLFDCKKTDEMNPYQSLYAASYKSPNNVMIMGNSPIILPTRVWLKNIEETDMSTLLNGASFDREKCALSEAFFKTIFENVDESGSTPFINDISHSYMKNHPNFDITTDKRILIPVPQAYLNPQTKETAETRSIIDKSARNHLARMSMDIYTLYSVYPICAKTVTTPNYGDTDFYIFATEYNTFDKNGEYVAGNLYLCGSCKNITSLNRDNRTVYSFDEKSRYVSLCADKTAYKSLRNRHPLPMAIPLNKGMINDWISNYIMPEFASLMGNEVITSRDIPEIQSNISKINLIPTKRNGTTYSYIKNKPQGSQFEDNKTDEQ